MEGKLWSDVLLLMMGVDQGCGHPFVAMVTIHALLLTNSTWIVDTDPQGYNCHMDPVDTCIIHTQTSCEASNTQCHMYADVFSCLEHGYVTVNPFPMFYSDCFVMASTGLVRPSKFVQRFL